MFKLQKHLISAGAGTGKTYQLIQNISLLFKGFQQAEQKEPRLIVCTFTKKATQELKERLLKKAMEDFSTKEALSFLQYSGSPQLKIATIDGILNQFLKQYAHKLGIKPDFQISDDPINSKLFDAMAGDFIYKTPIPLLEKLPYPYLKDLLLSYYRFRIQYGPISFYKAQDFEEFNKEKPDLICLESQKFISKANFEYYLTKNPQSLFKGLRYSSAKKMLEESLEFSGQDFLPLFKEFQQVAEEFFPLFLEKKKNSPFLEIEDLLLFSFYLLNKHPETAQSFCSEWDYWLIDEYQDTSWLQEQFIKKITNFERVFCVGDPAQSIYSFRFADPEVFKKREQELRKKGEEPLILNINRRSSASLIAFYNDFFPSPSEESPLTVKNFGTVKSTVSNPYKKLQALTSDLEDKSQACVSLMSYHKDQKEEVFPALFSCLQRWRQKGIPYKDMAILSSNNKDLSQTAQYLRKQNVPVLLYSSKKFSEQRVILDSLFLLKFLINPYDSTNLKALLRSPYFRMSDQELAQACYEQAHLENPPASFWSFLKQQKPHQALIRKLELYLEQAKLQGLIEAFRLALFDSGIMDLSYKQDPTFSTTANLWKLIDMLKNKSLSALEVFYTLLNQEQDSHNLKEAPSGEDQSSIPIMTVHASKGLEFEHVIILDFSLDRSDQRRGNKKSQNIIYDKHRNKMAFACPIGGRLEKKVKSLGHSLYNKNKDIEKSLERDRLFYVAMTRAKKSLTIFIPTLNKPEKNSWLERTQKHFFKQKSDFYISNPAGGLNLKQEWDLKPGLFPQKGYAIQIRPCSDFVTKKELSKQDSKPVSSSLKNEKTSEKQSPIKAFPKETKFESPSLIHKSSTDFIQYALNLKQKDFDQDGFSFVKTKNQLEKIALGKDLHFFGQKLFYFPDSDLQTLLRSRPPAIQQKLKTALNYILQLKNPNLSEYLKKGFVEWPFQFLWKNIILKGQIDLWFRSFPTAVSPEDSSRVSPASPRIDIVDYKSSKADKKSIQKTEKQLIFYSWVLSQQYPQDKIFMTACYPLEQKTFCKEFLPQHKQECENWLQSLNKNS